LPEYNPGKDLAGDDNAADWLSYFKYLINVWLIAIPYTIVGLLCVIYNYYFNVEWNRMWAGGNYWLVCNTIFIIVEYIISVMDAFEFPIFVRNYKVTRLFAAIFGFLYIWSYMVTVFEWYDMLYLVVDKTNYDFMTVYINMLLGYNIILHSSVIPICLFLVIKEISMEFF